jgi:hypothetical protein
LAYGQGIPYNKRNIFFITCQEWYQKMAELQTAMNVRLPASHASSFETYIVGQGRRCPISTLGAKTR